MLSPRKQLTNSTWINAPFAGIPSTTHLSLPEYSLKTVVLILLIPQFASSPATTSSATVVSSPQSRSQAVTPLRHLPLYALQAKLTYKRRARNHRRLLVPSTHLVPYSSLCIRIHLQSVLLRGLCYAELHCLCPQSSSQHGRTGSHDHNYHAFLSKASLS
jgi:hypothetical protein